MDVLTLAQRTGQPARVHSAGHADTGTDRIVSRFHHEALLYAGWRGFLEGTLPFVSDAIAAEEPIFVAVGDDKTELLRQALGRDARRVSFTDMRLLGDNPARIIPAWQRFLEENACQNRPVRGIGEPVWRERSAAEVTECHRHESLLNLAFGGGVAWRLLCPYDLDDLSEDVIEGARRNHPFLAEDGRSRPSDAYVPGDAAPGPFAGALTPPPAGAGELVFTGDATAWLRRLLGEWAAELELEHERTENLALAVTELASNSVRHGGGGGTLRMWCEEGTLLVEVRDRGRIEEPLAGRIRPRPEQPAGRGLWLVNHLCDLVQIRSAPTGSVVRVHMRRA